MQTAPLLDIDTAPRDQPGPSIQAPAPTMLKPREEERRHRLRRIARLLRPAPKTGVSGETSAARSRTSLGNPTPRQTQIYA